MRVVTIDHDTMRCVSEADAYVVRKVLVEARAAAGDDARLLCAEALPALLPVCQAAVCGEPRATWRAAISRALDAAVPRGTQALLAVHTMSGLLQALEAQVPEGAHEQRLISVLESSALSLVDDPRVRAPILLQLLRGATLAAGSTAAAITPLQARILAAISNLAQPPLHLTGLVQAPLLAALQGVDTALGGVTEPATAAAANTAMTRATVGARGVVNGGADSSGAELDATAACALFLEAADLARRGDQRGSKHGCLLVVETLEKATAVTSATASDDMQEQCAACDPTPMARVALPSHSTWVDDVGVDGDADREAVPLGGGRVARIVGAGWNREVTEQRGRHGRTRVLHAECHAVADAIRRHGEDVALGVLLPKATAWIVEYVQPAPQHRTFRDPFAAFHRLSITLGRLKEDVAAYEDAPPCRKCACLLRAVGVGRARHSTREGALRELRLPPHRPDLLRVEQACRPLAYALDDLGVHCEALEAALATSVSRHTDLSSEWCRSQAHQEKTESELVRCVTTNKHGACKRDARADPDAAVIPRTG